MKKSAFKNGIESEREGLSDSDDTKKMETLEKFNLENNFCLGLISVENCL